MRVLQVGRYFPPHVGGIETLAYNLTYGLNTRGIQCDVLCSNKENQYQLDKTENFSIHRTASYGQYFSVSATPQLISKLKEIGSQYDILHLHHPDPVATVALFLANPRCKVVVHWHSDIIRQRIPLIFFKPLQNWMLKRADSIIATSPNYLHGSTHILPFKNKVTIIPIGINPFLEAQNEVAEEKYRANGKVTIFALGRLVYYKGFRTLIDSAQYLEGNYSILIGGTGPLETKLRKRIAEKKVGQNVKLLGEIPNNMLPFYYKQADIFCLPSTVKTEAFGIVLLEAMSMGVPLVTSNLEDSGMSWVNQDQQTGLTIPPNDPKALADAIHKIGSNTSLSKKFSQAAKDRFNEFFTCDRMIDSVIQLYRSIS